MTIESDIKKVVDDIRCDYEIGVFTLQTIFDRHIESIESLKSSGVEYLTFCRLLDLEITEKHFQNLIFRAKNKKSKSNIQDKKKDIFFDNENTSVSTWKAEFPDVSERLVKEILDCGFTLEDSIAWCDVAGNRSSRTLRHKFNEMKLSKARKAKYSTGE